MADAGTRLSGRQGVDLPGDPSAIGLRHLRQGFGGRRLELNAVRHALLEFKALFNLRPGNDAIFLEGLLGQLDVDAIFDCLKHRKIVDRHQDRPNAVGKVDAKHGDRRAARAGH